MMKRKLNVLIACEESGKSRRAWRKRGHNAWSCDLRPARDGEKVYHIQGDARDVLHAKSWDVLIAHPPCTYLCNSGVCWLWAGAPHTHGIWIKNEARWQKLIEAIAFFNVFAKAKHIPHRAIENPIPHRYASLDKKYDQLIQPYMFGHPESKATCLWLYDLPKLVPTNDVKQIWKSLPKAKAQRLHYLSPGPERARLRSETYQGIADAMAEQWSNYILNK